MQARLACFSGSIGDPVMILGASAHVAAASRAPGSCPRITLISRSPRMLRTRIAGAFSRH
ncbi:hypothetical protein [Noviherbaspirillum galbum]|uniref:Uncharacterized protein n=1 Tax=Noviherbaspirillum galbum TaxID=2709383 RepID=A0A6B3SNN8_9BURK|nr:hypothetical protein [Noviherbaspirillum galbum]NEX62347.1 hypothetical protein [Noviherbaspirillum galbum]